MKPLLAACLTGAFLVFVSAGLLGPLVDHGIQWKDPRLYSNLFAIGCLVFSIMGCGEIKQLDKQIALLDKSIAEKKQRLLEALDRDYRGTHVDSYTEN